MFGKPEWFRVCDNRWGLAPIRFKGWVYSAGWGAVMAMPFIVFMLRGQAIEALIWLCVSMLAMSWDVKAIKRAKQDSVEAESVEQPADDVLYITDESVATANYNFQVPK